MFSLTTSCRYQLAARYQAQQFIRAYAALVKVSLVTPRGLADPYIKPEQCGSWNSSTHSLGVQMTGLFVLYSVGGAGLFWWPQYNRDKGTGCRTWAGEISWLLTLDYPDHIFPVTLTDDFATSQLLPAMMSSICSSAASSIWLASVSMAIEGSIRSQVFWCSAKEKKKNNRKFDLLAT